MTPSAVSDGSSSPAVEEQRHFAGTKRVSDAHKRQEHFRPPPTASSSSLTSMNFGGGAVDSAASAMEPFDAIELSRTSGQSQAAMYAAQGPTPGEQYYTQQYPISDGSPFQQGLSPIPPHAPPPDSIDTLAAHPLDMQPMYSMQSMMYNQALSNLSASLMQTPSPPQQPGPPSAQAQYPVPPVDNMEVLLNSLGVNGFVPDVQDNRGMLSMWSAAPNSFEYVID